MAAAIPTMEGTMLSRPYEKPSRMTMAGPVLAELAVFCTAFWSMSVKWSEVKPITIPANRPATVGQ